MKKLDLTLHCGAHHVTRDDVANVQTPQHTETWYPVAHERVLECVGRHLENGGLRVVHEAHALSHGGDRYFGLMQLANGHNEDDYGLVMGIRNSHDKSFPAALALGSGVFVCDNLAFSGEVKLARKHTRYIRRDMPGLVARAIGLLSDQRGLQAARIDLYKGQELDDLHAHDLMVRAIEAKACSGQQVPKILDQWREPEHDDFRPRTVWSLFNAFTEVYKSGSLMSTTLKSRALHGLMDSAVGLSV